MGVDAATIHLVRDGLNPRLRLGRGKYGTDRFIDDQTFDIGRRRGEDVAAGRERFFDDVG